MIHVHSICRAYRTRAVLRDVSFCLDEPRLTGLIGPGGSGKSTLLKVMAGLQRPQRGTIEFVDPLAGRVCRDAGLTDARMSLMFQEGALFDSLTVYENIAFPLVGGKIPVTSLDRNIQEQVNVRVSEILARVGLSRAAFKLPAQLSGGMRKRVSLARALVARPSFVMLDDPTAGLDPVASSVIMDLIVELYSEYRPHALVVSHDLRRLLPVVDDVIALFDGRVVFHGTIEELRRAALPSVHRFVQCRYELQ